MIENMARRFRYPADRSYKVLHEEQVIPKTILELIRIGLLFKIQPQGIDNLKHAQELAEKGNILFFFPNHISNADAPVVRSAMMQSGFDNVENIVALRGLKLDKNLLNRFLSHSFRVIDIYPPSLPADTEEKKRQKSIVNEKADEFVGQAIKEHRPILIFPEGGRSYDGKLKQAERGIVHYLTMVQNTDAIVIPIGIKGTNEVMPPHKKLILPNPRLTVNVIFGEPINASSLIRTSPLSGTRMRREVITHIMKTGVAKCLPEEQRGFYA